MRRNIISNDSIAMLLYQLVADRSLSEHDMHMLRQWLARSRYNRSLLRDMLADDNLRSVLLSSGTKDPSEFWTIVVRYRTAMHNGMDARSGNFWERLFQWKALHFHIGQKE